MPERLETVGYGALSDRDFRRLSEYIERELGIRMPDTKRVMLESRLQKRVRLLGLDGFPAYVDYVFSDEGSRHEILNMIDAVTTNKTDFFREADHFDFIERTLVPEAMVAGGGRPLRFWSAGCSTGEEPYTIAMLLREILPAAWSFEIIASDISLKSLMVGKEGFYNETRIQGIPDNYLAKYFEKKPNGYQIKDEIRKTIRFDYHNLKNDSGARNLDVVFCRNVLIYFDEAAQKASIERFWEAMAPKSFLFIGHSESLFGMNTRFEFVKTDWACFYKKSI